MSDYYYPPIENDAAQNVVTMMVLARTHSDYLTDPACPYPVEFIQLIQELTTNKAVEVPKKVDDVPLVGTDKWSQLAHESRQLFDNLKNSYEKIKDEEVAERMAYFRTAASLLDKLVGLQERAAGLKQMSEFQNMVIQFLDEIATPDQRTELMARMATVQMSEGSTNVSQEIKSDSKAGPADNAGAGAP